MLSQSSLVPSALADGWPAPAVLVSRVVGEDKVPSRRMLPPADFHSKKSRNKDRNPQAAKVFSKSGCAKPGEEAWPDCNGRPVVFVRAGGVGDLIFIFPLISEVKRRWPLSVVMISCSSRYHAVVASSMADAILPHPLPEEYADADAVVVRLDGAIEKHVDAREANAVQIFARHAGLTLADEQPRFKPTAAQIALGRTLWPKRKSARLGVQLSSSALCRDYPQPLLFDAMNMLLNDGWELYLFGYPGEVQTYPHPKVVNLCEQKLVLNESIAAITTCDAFMGPDSGLLHIAGAMGLPALGLYGPFPAKLRVSVFPLVDYLQGQASCAPCFHHASVRKQWPKHGPCNASQRCEALARIKPSIIARKIREIHRRHFDA
ncbi:MAG TPA: glycosyltransferase family 9 protein [Opitutales bacterium]|nr:glycosyltransferase family 9 protein [Opitutales bacterium]